jgi:glucokinase-like ROK family protein
VTSVAPRLALPSAASDRAEHLQTLTQLLRLIRRGGAVTRSDLVAGSGLSRSVVTQRVGQLVDLGLAEEAGLAASTGGRAARRLSLRGEAGRLLAVFSGATGVTVAVTDLNGVVLRQADAGIGVSIGPDVFLDEVERLASGLLRQADDGPVWGIGIGLPGPIEFASGRPTLPPIMPGWDGYDVRARFAERFGAPTWVDNDANVLALGELHAGLGQGLEDLVYVKIGTGIGAGLVSRGAIHRGAQGAAGDVGHVEVVDGSPVVCRCGNKGCLEALAGGAAITRDAVTAVADSPAGELAAVLAEKGTLTPSDIGAAAQRGDRTAMRLLGNSGKLVGEMLATLVSFFNPALVVLGGSVAETGGVFLTAVREAVYRRSLPLATRELRIEVSTLGQSGGVVGAAALALEEIFVPERLGEWIANGPPGWRAGQERHG